MPGTHSSLYLHLVCGTHGREPLFTADLRPRAFEFMGGIVRGERGVLMAAGGVDDHFHLLVSWRTDGTIADLMREVKSRSSRWLHQTFAHLRGFAWQEGYAAFTVSRSQVGVVDRYIRGQEEHHRTRTFMEELVLLLEAHGVEYDPRYLE
jgi:REP element-mobilizing transposase RayT